MYGRYFFGICFKISSTSFEPSLGLRKCNTMRPLSNKSVIRCTSVGEVPDDVIANTSMKQIRAEVTKTKKMSNTYGLASPKLLVNNLN